MPAPGKGRARRVLTILGAVFAVVVLSATALYSYPSTLGGFRAGLALLHELSGDLAVLLSGVYLWLHLPRVWPGHRFRLSRFSGILSVAIWLVAAGTGFYGQLTPLESSGALYRLHLWASLAITVTACFHGAWAYRPQRRSERD